MSKITLVLGFTGASYALGLLEYFLKQSYVSKVLVLAGDKPEMLPKGCEYRKGSWPASGEIINRIAAEVKTPYLLFLQPNWHVALGPAALERFVEVVATTRAGLVYSDYYEIKGGEGQEHRVNEYQLGSIRDDFDFGPLTIFSTAAVRRSLRKWGPAAGSAGAGVYDLRLKVSLEQPVYHLRECLYTAEGAEGAPGLFSYVDPGNYVRQKELEDIATEHLRRLGAYLEPVYTKPPLARQTFPVEASIVIPVRNRAHTIAQAVESALGQEADFPFNVLVVDNHSTDGTTALLAELAGRHAVLHPMIPKRRDLNIGGCWNEALFSPACGRYAVQLDSDDLYASPQVLQKIVALLRRGHYAMVVGSYTLVNADLEEIPPGLIDHREWTKTNGRNNALRVNGLGAPRAFNTEIIRKFGFLNVGYGEDYALALRISREYEIGRIYENLYLCRRWGGNSDAALTIDRKNRYDAFKDQIRTLEIVARQKLNQSGRKRGIK